MLVMTTIFTSKIEELPPTSDMKMIDIWLICCLVIPFLEVILRTTIECLDCSCDICQDKKSGEKNAVLQVFVGNGGKVAPEQVITAKVINLDQERGSSTLADQQDKMVEESLKVSGGSCSKGAWRQIFELTGDIFSVHKSQK